MTDKLFDSEAKIMEIIWSKKPHFGKGNQPDIRRNHRMEQKHDLYGHKKKLEAKGFIRREDPGFICTPLISRDQVQKAEAESLLKKGFQRFPKSFVLRIDRERASVCGRDRRTAKAN